MQIKPHKVSKALKRFEGVETERMSFQRLWWMRGVEESFDWKKSTGGYESEELMRMFDQKLVEFIHD